jgi:hypothetical protein
MSAIRRLLVALAALAVLAAPAAGRAADISVAAQLAPRPLLFGAHGVARVTVIVDARRVNVDSIRIAAPLAPLTTVAATTRRHRAGDLVRVTFERVVVCDSDACVPGARRLLVRLGAIRVTARSRDDRLLRAAATWPSLRIVSRLSAAAIAAADPPFRVPADLPAPSYRVSPTRLSRAFLAGGLLALIAGAGLVVPPLVRRGRRPADELALEHALRAVRSSLDADAPLRRRALEALARVLDDRRGTAAGDGVRTLAWAEPAPDPQAMSALADEVEQAEGRR